MRLIDANKLWVELDTAHLFDDGNPRHIAQQTVEQQPTVDAVEVVRCKDCKNREWFEPAKNYFCDIADGCVNDEHFCSYGERKENEN